MTTLRLLVAPRHERLATLAAAKARLGIAPEDAGQDARLLALLNAVSAAISANRPALGVRARWEERWACGTPGGELLPLSRYPIEADSLELTNAAEPVTFRVHDASVGLLARTRIFSDLTAIYWAGYVPPEDLADWVGDLDVEPGQWLRVPLLPMLFEVIQSGALGTAPTSAEAGDEIDSGTARVAARQVAVVPVNVQHIAVNLLAAEFERENLRMAAGVTSLRGADFSATFAAEGGSLACETERALAEVPL